MMTAETMRAEGLNAVAVAEGELFHPECAEQLRIEDGEPTAWEGVGARCAKCGGTITGTSDAATALLMDGYTSRQSGPKRAGCYICEDPEFARMGLPLCRACPKCGGHVAADDTVCDDCGHDSMEDAEL